MELNRLTGTVTIAAAYGSGGRVIGPAVAERLGLPFVDRAIPSSLVEKFYEPLARGSRHWGGGL
jgi:hypothetical protein